MKNRYAKLMFTAIGMLLGMFLIAQERVVVVEPDDDLNLNEFILADTTADGNWVDTVNTVYELKRNSLYRVSSQIDVRGTKLHIRGQEGEGQKPVIMQRIKEDGTFNKLLYTRGDAIIENVRLNAEEQGLSYSWNAIRLLGEGSTVIFRNCIIEKQGGAVAALYGENVSVTIDRCEVRYLGQPTRVTGNGRIIDGRKSSRYVKVVDSYFYNVMATLFAGWGQEHKYVEFDHNTFVNMAGQNRIFQFNRIVDTVKVTNNIFMNCFFSGDYPAKMPDDKAADASHGDYPGTLAYFNAYDSLPPDRNQWTISNNNIFYTENFADSVATYPDTVVMPPVLSPNFAEWLGDAAADVYFEEVLDFPSTPETPTWVWKNFYNDPDLTEHGYFVPAHPLADDPNWYKFDPNSIDLSYLDRSISATAGTDGGQIGSRLFDLISTVGVETSENHLAVTPYPNPASGYVTFRFSDRMNGPGKMEIYSVTGQLLKETPFDPYTKEVRVDLIGFTKGLYVYKLISLQEGITGKFIVK